MGVIGILHDGGAMIFPLGVAGILAAYLILKIYSEIKQKTITPRVLQQLDWVQILAQIMPMLGLLGTVIGMAQVFRILGAQNAYNAQLMAGGISEALVCTEVGLILAIPTMFGHSILAAIVGRLIPMPANSAQLGTESIWKKIVRGCTGLLLVVLILELAAFVSHHSRNTPELPNLMVITVTDAPVQAHQASPAKPLPPEPPKPPIVANPVRPVVPPVAAAKVSATAPSAPAASPAPKVDSGTAIADLADADGLPQIVEKIRPQYPAVAREAGVECVMILSMVVNTDGTVDSAEVLQVSNPGFGFEAAALKAAYEMRFKPITQRGVPVKVKVYYPIRFVLKDK